MEDRDAVLSATAKLEEAASLAVAGQYVAIDVSVDPSVRDDVDRALREHRELSIEYASATSDEVTTRTIQPLRLFTVDGVSYLEANCLMAGALRTFRLDRVRASTLRDPFPEPADVDITARSGDPQRPREPDRVATVLLDPSARWIIDVHRAVEDTVRLVDGRTRVRLPLYSDEWAVRLVLSLRGAATIIEPAELAQAVAVAAQAALSAYPVDVQ